MEPRRRQPPGHTEPDAKTIRLARGRHASPREGACVMELASSLAGEPFSDHPASVCPVIAAFLRTYNDALTDSFRHELFPYASMAVGTRADRRTRRWRRMTLLRWTHRDQPKRRLRIVSLLCPATLIAEDAARDAALLPRSRRRREVDALLELLVRGPSPVEPRLVMAPGRATRRAASVEAARGPFRASGLLDELRLAAVGGLAVDHEHVDGDEGQ